jgi:SAM-dependent methyltransferase
MRPCPVCGDVDAKKLYTQRFSDGPLGEGYHVTVCRQCGAGYADGIPTQKQLDEYYANCSKYSYDHSKGLESHWDFARFEATFRQIEPFIQSSHIRILDIGCATGGMLSVFKQHGYNNLVGTDPSEACVSTAKRLHGIEARVATLSALTTWSERFDLILLIGVLEHIREAAEAGRIVKRLLTSTGALYCAVPDVCGLTTNSNAPYQQFSVEHFNFFSVKSLRNLMSSCELSPVSEWNWKIQWSGSAWEPIASGLYKGGLTTTRTFDNLTEPAIRAYLDFSARGEENVANLIDALRRDNEPLIVWGAGTLARHLLATTNFAKLNITMFVDGNPRLHGKSLANRTILPPQAIAKRHETILICSGSFGAEIRKDIHEIVGDSRKIISILG